MPDFDSLLDFALLPLFLDFEAFDLDLLLFFDFELFGSTSKTVGRSVFCFVGNDVFTRVGDPVPGSMFVGAFVGKRDGKLEGRKLGSKEGDDVGEAEGLELGNRDLDGL